MASLTEQCAAARAFAAQAAREAALAEGFARAAEAACDEALLRYERQVTAWLLRHPNGVIGDHVIGRRSDRH